VTTITWLSLVSLAASVAWNIAQYCQARERRYDIYEQEVYRQRFLLYLELWKIAVALHRAVCLGAERPKCYRKALDLFECLQRGLLLIDEPVRQQAHWLQTKAWKITSDRSPGSSEDKSALDELAECLNDLRKEIYRVLGISHLSQPLARISDQDFVEPLSIDPDTELSTNE